MINLRSAFITAIGLLAVLSFCAALFHARNPIARAAGDYASSVAAVSAATYVTLRTLNAVLSTAQEVEVGASVGVSGTFQPGKVLEPVDDTIERIASVVFALMLVSGILAIAMAPIGALGSAMVAIACLFALAGPGGSLRAAARRLGLYGAFLSLGLPLCLIVSDMLAAPLTGAALAEHQAVVAQIVDAVPLSATDTTKNDLEDERWFAGLRDTFSAGSDHLALARNIMRDADTLIKSYLSILAVLIFRLFLLPVLLVGCLWLVVRSSAKP